MQFRVMCMSCANIDKCHACAARTPICHDSRWRFERFGQRQQQNLGVTYINIYKNSPIWYIYTILIHRIVALWQYDYVATVTKQVKVVHTYIHIYLSYKFAWPETEKVNVVRACNSIRRKRRSKKICFQQNLTCINLGLHFYQRFYYRCWGQIMLTLLRWKHGHKIAIMQSLMPALKWVCWRIKYDDFAHDYDVMLAKWPPWNNNY